MAHRQADKIHENAVIVGENNQNAVMSAENEGFCPISIRSRSDSRLASEKRLPQAHEGAFRPCGGHDREPLLWMSDQVHDPDHDDHQRSARASFGARLRGATDPD